MGLVGCEVSSSDFMSDIAAHPPDAAYPRRKEAPSNPRSKGPFVQRRETMQRTASYTQMIESGTIAQWRKKLSHVPLLFMTPNV
jgi:hypothetical protein